MKKIISIITVGILFILPSISQAQVAITAVPFLQIEPDSRGAGMGNTGVAIADNASAMFWNPAGLAFQKDNNQASITHSNWLANFDVSDLFYDYIVGKYYIEGIGTVGAHLTYLNLGEQVITDETGPEPISRFNSYELAFGASYGRQVNDNFGVGGSLRIIYSSLATGTSVTIGSQRVNPGSSVAVDLSFLYKTDPFYLGGKEAQFNFGTNLSNLGPGIQYTDNAQKDPLPTVLRFGWSLDLNLDDEGINSITIANDISKIMARTEQYQVQVGEQGQDSTVTRTRPVGPLKALVESWSSFQQFNGQETVEVGLMQQFMVGAGIEYWYDKKFALRGGYYYEDPNNGDREYITFGAGLRYSFIGVDFSYIKTLESDHPLANTLRFSLLLDF